MELVWIIGYWQPYPIRCSIIFEMVQDTTVTQEAHIKVVREQSDELDINGNSNSSNSSDNNNSSEDELEES